MGRVLNIPAVAFSLVFAGILKSYTWYSLLLVSFIKVVNLLCKIIVSHWYM